MARFLTSLAHLKGTRTQRATDTWHREIQTNGRRTGTKAFRLPSETHSRPRIRDQLKGVPKGVTARYYQLLSGHALTAVRLKDKWGWTDTDTCWWCTKGRQTREYPLKECLAGKE